MNYRHLLAFLLSLSLSNLATAQLIAPSSDRLADRSTLGLDSLDSDQSSPRQAEGQTISLRGEITGFEFVQPETRVLINSNGQNWELLAPSAVELRRLGWSSDSLFVGEKVEAQIVELSGARNLGKLQRLTRANGALLVTGLGSDNQGSRGFGDIDAGIYALDPKQAHLQFRFDHLGFSKTPVKVERLSGRVLWDSAEPEASIIQIDMDASSIRSGVTALDEALRGADFFNFLNYPKIRFNSTGLSLSRWGTLTVNGQLAILGVSQPVSIEARVNKIGLNELTQKTTVGISARGELQRSTWGMTDYLPMISDRVEILFEGEFVLTAENPASGLD